MLAPTHAMDTHRKAGRNIRTHTYIGAVLGVRLILLTSGGVGRMLIRVGEVSVPR